MTDQMISTPTFACELCAQVHVAGEASFRVTKFHCSQVGDIAGCIARLRDRRLHTCGHTKRAWYDKTIAELERQADPHCAIKRQLVQKHRLQTVKADKLEKLWRIADLWLASCPEDRRTDETYDEIVGLLLPFGRVW